MIYSKSSAIFTPTEATASKDRKIFANTVNAYAKMLCK